ncbi:hypothetical protein ACSBR2_020163 [Camellia fascicularis]
MQAFRKVDDAPAIGRSGPGGSGVMGSFVCDVTPLRVVDDRGYRSGYGDVVAGAESIELQVHEPVGVHFCDSKVEVVHEVGEGAPGLGMQNSLVRNIKSKVRKERKFPEYEYPFVDMCDGMIGIGNENVRGNENCVTGNVVIDVEAVVLPWKKWSGFGINNRLGV